MLEKDSREGIKGTFKTYLQTTREALYMAEKAMNENNTAMAQFWVDGPVKGSTAELSAIVKYIRDVF